MGRRFLALGMLVLAAACGGRSQEQSDGNAGKGGAGKGGAGATGGTSGTGGGTGGASGTTGGSGDSGGTGGTTGGSDGTGGATGGAGGATAATGGGGAGGTQGCCLAFPTCPPDEMEISGPEECPPELAGSTCHEVTVCCSTIWCAKPGGAGTGGAGGTGAGGTGNAGSGGALPCNPEVEHDRNYLGDAQSCLLIDFFCADPTFDFYNECGCGCEQDAACPPSFYCGANAKVGELPCTPENLARCPFSERLE